MRFAAIVMSIVLTVMTGVVLNQFWSLEQTPAPSIQTSSDSGVQETAMAFYDAVNTYLESGAERAIRERLHPAFATHRPGSDWTGTADTFLQQLDSVRGLFPGIQVEAKPVSIGSSTVAIALTVSVTSVSSFAGISLDPDDLVGRMDLVRIERGLIAEHWSSATLAGQFAAYPELSIELPVAVDRLNSRVQQIELANVPTEAVSYPTRHFLIVVTSGKALLTVESKLTNPAMVWRAGDRYARPATPIEPGTPASLAPMEAAYLPAGTKFLLQDSASDETHVIALEFGPPVLTVNIHEDPLFESLQGTLWSGVTLAGVGSRLTLTFGRAVMAPASTLSNPQGDGLQLVLITAGSLDMASAGGGARLRKADGTRTQISGGFESLVTGESGATGPGASTAYRDNSEELTQAWFFSIVPEPRVGTPSPIPTPTRNPTIS